MLLYIGMDDASSCRKRAKEAREIAEKVKHPLDKAARVKVADEWIRFAETAEARTESPASSMANGMKWTPPEDERLRTLKATGQQNVRIAEQLTRTERAVVARLVFLKKQIVKD